MLRFSKDFLSYSVNQTLSKVRGNKEGIHVHASSLCFSYLSNSDKNAALSRYMYITSPAYVYH